VRSSNASLTIVIATAGRRESLQQTLAALGPLTGRTDVEVVVVDNAPEPELKPDDLAVLQSNVSRLLHEPSPGKGRALNRALRDGVGEIVAILDDDMTPMPGWADAVLTSVHSRPDFDVFAGRSHVVWPKGVPEPAWAGHWLARGLAFSVVDGDSVDREMGAGNLSHPSGNHFWFRRTVLSSVAAFRPVWGPEPEFVITARVHGHRGVFVPEVSCGHRIQPELVDAQAFIERADRYGRSQASFPPENERGAGRAQSSLLRALPRPMVWRGKRLLWWMRGQRARLRPPAQAVPLRARANMMFCYYDQMLRNTRSSR